jgi:hypothetical protein
MAFSSVYIGLAVLGVMHAAPQLLTPSQKQVFALVKPSLQWLISGSIVAAGAPSLFCVASIPHAAMAALALLSLGAQNPLAQQLLYGPALMSLVAWLFKHNLHGVNVSMSSALAFALIQFVNIALGAVVTMLYPASIVPSLMDVGKMRAAIERDPQGIQFAQIPLIGHPQVLLDGIIIPPAQQAPKFARRKFLLYLGGNGEMFEMTYVSLVMLADRLGVTVVMANPMGVGRSAGITGSGDDLVLAARSTAEWILKSKEGSSHPAVSHRDIVVFGHSIGGGVASRLVAQHYPEFGLVLDRTFSSLSDAAISLSPVTKNPRFVRFVLWFSGFGDLNTAKNFDDVPHSRKLITFHRDDQIIKFKESSIARLDTFQKGSGNLAGFVAELRSHKFTADPHNIGIADLDGFDEASKKILSFYERTLASS